MDFPLCITPLRQVLLLRTSNQRQAFTAFELPEFDSIHIAEDTSHEPDFQ